MAEKMTVPSYVRKKEGAGFEGEVRTIYTSRAGIHMAVVEIIDGPFAGMQHIYRLSQLEAASPSPWFSAGHRALDEASHG
jgi:hypothetical protein